MTDSPASDTSGLESDDDDIPTIDDVLAVSTGSPSASASASNTSPGDLSLSGSIHAYALRRGTGVFSQS